MYLSFFFLVRQNKVEGFLVAPSVPSCVTTGNLLNHSVPPFPHLENGDNDNRAFLIECYEE